MKLYLQKTRGSEAVANTRKRRPLINEHGEITSFVQRQANGVVERLVVREVGHVPKKHPSQDVRQ